MGFLEDDTNEAHERRITRCKSCNAQIIWFETPRGSRMPIDADSVDPEDEELLLGKHISHFATCPQADQHRRPR